MLLTSEERSAIPQAPEIVFYCLACLRVMRDKEAGAQLLKGLYEMQLRQLGVPGAQERAQLFYDRLTQGKANG